MIKSRGTQCFRTLGQRVREEKKAKDNCLWCRRGEPSREQTGSAAAADIRFEMCAVGSADAHLVRNVSGTGGETWVGDRDGEGGLQEGGSQAEDDIVPAKKGKREGRALYLKFSGTQQGLSHQPGRCDIIRERLLMQSHRTAGPSTLPSFPCPRSIWEIAQKGGF